MSGTCRYEGCTVDDLGSCALERDPATCSNRIVGAAAGSLEPDEYAERDPGEGLRPGAPVLEQPAGAKSFPASRTLGLDDLSKLMSTRYVTVVGILGDPESGKTACLASLYLLISNAGLAGWTFGDSRSLMAFEEIARGARDWNNGSPPEQMTVHTEMADERRPGFLHLRLVRRSDGHRVDLALPDLPGEWTQALVASANADRLDFMKAAEVIWIVVDGRTLADVERRQGLVARIGQLMGRMSTMLDGALPRLLVVVTHIDTHEVSDWATQRLGAELARRGATAEIIGIAPFSDNADTVPAGAGISQLIERTVGGPAAPRDFWAPSDPGEGGRAYLRHRRDR